MSCSINEAALVIALKQVSTTDYFETLQCELSKHFKIKLLTFTLIDMSSHQAKRLYSSNTDSYAIGGFKSIESNAWSKQVIDQQKAFIAHKHSELATVFFDHELIAQLGLGSVINWPVTVHNKVIGTVNLLAEEDAYLDCDLQAMQMLTPWLAIPFLFDLTNKE
jgi:hypothetical protein